MAELAGLKLENKSWPGGTHSLRYHHLALSEPGLGRPHFLAVGYVDDQPFIRYDSHVGKAQPQVPWMAPVDTQYWEMETKKHRSWEEVQQVEIWTLMSYYNQSGGTHSTQHMFGCDIREDGRSSSFWQFGFDGQDHLTLDLETLSWVSAVPMAVRTKHWWESQHCYAEYNKAYLETLCLTSLHRYLELGGQHFTRREAPTVQVTRLLTQDGDAMLRCWALGFYPRDISLSWWLGEEELALETEHVETRPSGDGTYQTWAAVWVPAGEEARYTCHVQHSGLNHTLTVAWEPPSHHGLIVVVVPLFLLLLVVGGGVVICIKRFPQGRWGRNKGSPSTFFPVGGQEPP
ncbi:H-2 class I histocompatibility antigen, Q10 alpha chain-like isoform 1-T1 [Hipposideros larvatus]